MPASGDVDIRRVDEDRSRSTPRYEVLVDRLWPRGLTRAEVGLDEWSKEVAPSNELRRWYDHDISRFDEFAERYRLELARPSAAAAVQALAARAGSRRLVLLTATRDVEHSGAAVLRAHLVALRSGQARRPRRRRPRAGRPSVASAAGTADGGASRPSR